MIPAQFDYHAPKSLDEAIALLSQNAGNAKVLAGGQSLIPAMRFRLATPEVLVDISRISQLEYVREQNGYLAIGALTRETALEESPLIAEKYPLLFDTAKVVADPLVRQRATVGGNLAHADPANDHPATMLAYGAQVVARGPKGERVIAIDDFFTGLFESALEAGEILTEVRIPSPKPQSSGAYVKIERKVGDYATTAVAVQLEAAGDVCKAIRIGLTNMSPTPMRAKAAEAKLVGQPLTQQNLEAAAQLAAGECDPSSDLRGSAEYKRDVTRVVVKRAILLAHSRVKGARA
ncbi:MAG TPA: xanthine dehydrogenase family protein subunit M [Polyangiaceae bacterium]|nr:xanthine dehydrogenase family protein subunit M [Polyangiaceae bacterium]